MVLYRSVHTILSPQQCNLYPDSIMRSWPFASFLSLILTRCFLLIVIFICFILTNANNTNIKSSNENNSDGAKSIGAQILSYYADISIVANDTNNTTPNPNLLSNLFSLTNSSLRSILLNSSEEISRNHLQDEALPLFISRLKIGNLIKPDNNHNDDDYNAANSDSVFPSNSVFQLIEFIDTINSNKNDDINLVRSLSTAAHHNPLLIDQFSAVPAPSPSDSDTNLRSIFSSSSPSPVSSLSSPSSAFSLAHLESLVSMSSSSLSNIIGPPSYQTHINMQINRDLEQYQQSLRTHSIDEYSSLSPTSPLGFSTSSPPSSSSPSSTTSNSNDYELHGRVGRGSYGEIWKARKIRHHHQQNHQHQRQPIKEMPETFSTSTGDSSDDLYVLKRLFVEKGDSVRLSGVREIHFGEILRYQSHVARFVEYFHRGNEIWLVFRYEGINLSSYIHQPKGSHDSTITESQEWIRLKLDLIDHSQWKEWRRKLEDKDPRIKEFRRKYQNHQYEQVDEMYEEKPGKGYEDEDEIDENHSIVDIRRIIGNSLPSSLLQCETFISFCKKALSSREFNFPMVRKELTSQENNLNDKDNSNRFLLPLEQECVPNESDFNFFCQLIDPNLSSKELQSKSHQVLVNNHPSNPSSPEQIREVLNTCPLNFSSSLISRDDHDVGYINKYSLLPITQRPLQNKFFPSSSSSYSFTGGLLLRDLIFQILIGIAEGHRLGVTHRDIKPANILIKLKTPKLTNQILNQRQSDNQSNNKKNNSTDDLPSSNKDYRPTKATRAASRQEFILRSRWKEEDFIGSEEEEEEDEEQDDGILDSSSLPLPSVGYVRLCDYGSSIDSSPLITKELYLPDGPTIAESSLDYAPPEILFSSFSNKQDNTNLQDPDTFDHTLLSLYGPAYDSWSIGVIILELLLGSRNRVFGLDSRTIALINSRLGPGVESDVKEKAVLLKSLINYCIYVPSQQTEEEEKSEKKRKEIFIKGEEQRKSSKLKSKIPSSFPSSSSASSSSSSQSTSCDEYDLADMIKQADPLGIGVGIIYPPRTSPNRPTANESTFLPSFGSTSSPPSLSYLLIDLIRSFLRWNSFDRLSIEESLDHAYFHDDWWRCHICNQTFKTRLQMNKHNAEKHKQKSN